MWRAAPLAVGALLVAYLLWNPQNAGNTNGHGTVPDGAVLGAKHQRDDWASGVNIGDGGPRYAAPTADGPTEYVGEYMALDDTRSASLAEEAVITVGEYLDPSADPTEGQAADGVAEMPQDVGEWLDPDLETYDIETDAEEPVEVGAFIDIDSLPYVKGDVSSADAVPDDIYLEP